MYYKFFFQKCPYPYCPYGQITDKCQCIKKYKSVCPEYYEPAWKQIDYKKKCACRKVVYPECPKSSVLNKKTCDCEIKTYPTCPYDTKLKGNAWCWGIKYPVCPKGTELDKYSCKCVDWKQPECKYGYLTYDRCYCEQTTYPVCNSYDYNGNNYKCTLNKKWCTCEKSYGEISNY